MILGKLFGLSNLHVLICKVLIFKDLLCEVLLEFNEKLVSRIHGFTSNTGISYYCCCLYIFSHYLR